VLDLPKQAVGSGADAKNPYDSFPRLLLPASQLLEVERKARKLDARRKEDAKLAKEELQTNIADSELFVLPSKSEACMSLGAAAH